MEGKAVQKSRKPRRKQPQKGSEEKKPDNKAEVTPPVSSGPKEVPKPKTPPKRKFGASGDSSLDAQSFKRRKVEKAATGDALTDYEKQQIEEEDSKTPAEVQKEKEQLKKAAKLKKKKEDRKEKVQKLYGQWDNIQYADKNKIAEYFSTKIVEALSSTVSAEELKNMPFGAHMWATVPRNPKKDEHQQFDIEHLPKAVSTIVPDLLKEKLVVPNSTPLVFVISSNTERVLTFSKEFYKLGRHVTTKPIFARHRPLEAQLKEVKLGSFRICVATPGRLLQLLDAGALQLKLCKLVVLDMTADAKGNTGLNQFEMRRDVSQIFWKHLKDQKGIKWALY